MSHQKDLLAALARNPLPPVRLLPPHTQALRYLTVALLLGAVAVVVLRAREDILLELTSTRGFLEVAVLLGVLLSAVVVAIRSARPGLSLRSPALTTIFFLFAWPIIVSLTHQTSLGYHATAGEPEIYCGLLALLLGGIMTGLLASVVRRGYITAPLTTILFSVVAGFAVAALVLTLVCPDNLLSHHFWWHMGPLYGVGVVAVGVGWLWGRRG